MGVVGDEEKGSGYFTVGKKMKHYVFCRETEIRQKRSQRQKRSRWISERSWQNLLGGRCWKISQRGGNGQRLGRSAATVAAEARLVEYEGKRSQLWPTRAATAAVIFDIGEKAKEAEGEGNDCDGRPTDGEV
ncbi:hypothetical protein BHM03_00031020 [Ensete ventricosum]|nr:hypothetical protein BHM03_00031020 [Ensete ventricosum]